jgi:ABC-type transporter Mla subunit MlaD
MPVDTFRVIVTVGVLLACIAFLVQAAVAIAFYRTVNKLHGKITELTATVASTVQTIGPVVEKIGPVLDRAAPVVERLGPMFDQATATIQQIKPVVERAVVVIDGAKRVVETVDQIVVEARPHIADFSEEAVTAARTARDEVERIGELLNDAVARAHARLEQIDNSLGHTLEQVEHVSDAMKRVVLRPVREANGVAAGISAAVSTLVRPRKDSPGAATQDEEMFI